MVRKAYNAEVLLAIPTSGKETEEELAYAAIEAEMRINQIGGFEYKDGILGLRLHLKGEKNGDNKD